MATEIVNNDVRTHELVEYCVQFKHRGNTFRTEPLSKNRAERIAVQAVAFDTEDVRIIPCITIEGYLRSL